MHVYFSHNGVDHTAEPSTIAHFIKTDGIKVLAIAIIATVLILVAVKLLSGKPTVKLDTNKLKQGDNNE